MIGAAVCDLELGKLRWRCRRGLRELDLLLTQYVEEQYAGASLAHQAAFRALLDFDDPLIYDYFLGHRAVPNAALGSLIERITARSGNG